MFGFLFIITIFRLVFVPDYVYLGIMFCTITVKFLIVANDSNLPQKRGRHIGVQFFQGRVSEPGAMYKNNIGCAIVTWFTYAVPE